jgi:hypothetical protein
MRKTKGQPKWTAHDNHLDAKAIVAPTPIAA